LYFHFDSACTFDYRRHNNQQFPAATVPTRLHQTHAVKSPIPIVW